MSNIYDVLNTATTESGIANEFLQKDLENDLQRDNCNIAIFAGAGFSMAWDAKYPNGNKLFGIDKKDIKNYKNFSFVSLADSFQLKWLSEADKSSDEERAEVFCNLKFQIDIYKKYPTLLPSYIDKATIEHVEESVGLFVKKRLEEFVGKDELSLEYKKKLDKDKNAILNLFKRMKERKGGLTFITTNYNLVLDRLVRQSGLEEHPVRGIFDKVAFESDNWCPKVNNCSLFKLNGGLEIYKVNNEYQVSYANISDSLSAPKLIVPSREQNYTDNYFKSIFVKTCNKLRDSSRLLFIGYSLPEEDHVIKFLLQSFVDSGHSNKEVYIIDYGLENANSVKKRLDSLFPELATNDAIKVFNGTFNDFCEYF